MRAGVSLQQLATTVKQINDSKKDYVVNGHALSFEGDRMSVSGLGEFSMNKHCLGQVGDFLGVPRRYLYKMLESGQRDLLAENLNTWMKSEHREDERMIRTIGSGAGDNIARAFLSDRYRPLDNYDLLGSVVPVLSDLGVEVRSTELTEDRLYLKATLPNMQHELKVGSVVEAGIVISNSEVGSGSINIQPLLYCLWCTNGAVFNDVRMRKYHVGRNNYEVAAGFQHLLHDETKEKADEAFWMQVRDVVRGTFSKDIFGRMIERATEASEQKIVGNVEKVVEVTAKKYGFSDEIRANVLDQLIKDGDLTRLGLSGAVTYVSHSMDGISYQQATDMEIVGGDILSLSKRDWDLINKAA